MQICRIDVKWSKNVWTSWIYARIVCDRAPLTHSAHTADQPSHCAGFSAFAIFVDRFCLCCFIGVSLFVRNALYIGLVALSSASRYPPIWLNNSFHSHSSSIIETYTNVITLFLSFCVRVLSAFVAFWIYVPLHGATTQHASIGASKLTELNDNSDSGKSNGRRTKTAEPFFLTGRSAVDQHSPLNSTKSMSHRSYAYVRARV